MHERPLPVFVNAESGSAGQALERLQGEARIALRRLAPRELTAAIDEEVERGRSRLAICGGDGTIALAASRLVGSGTELAVLPGGTLNHFAARLGIPADCGEALELALNGSARPVDVGYVNEHLFINTSSVGAYVVFVRSREYLERRMNYHLASLLAGFRRLVRLRSAHLQLDGKPLRTPLVFIGVGEREVRFPALGQEKSQGRSGLHLIAVKSRGSLETLFLAFNAIFRGVDPMDRADQLESRVLEQVELTYRRRKRQLIVAADGELVRLEAPLKYRYEEGAFSVVGP